MKRSLVLLLLLLSTNGCWVFTHDPARVSTTTTTSARMADGGRDAR
jgi:hypothetical protein